MRKKYILLCVAIVIIIIILAIYGIIRHITIGQMTYIEIDKSDENLGIKKSDALLSAIEREKLFKENQKFFSGEQQVESNNKESKLFHILLLGLDSRSKTYKGSRSDAIMLLTIDFSNKEIKLSSFVRDLQVEVKGKKDKITHAYAYGGGELTLRTLNQTFNLDIRDFAVVNMFDLREIIDTIGGLEIEVNETELEELNYRVQEIAEVESRTDYILLTESGYQHLNGEQVVAYSRIRSTAGGDYTRTERQREVISLVINKMKEKNIVDLVGLANKLLPLISTTLTTSEIENLLLKGVSNGLDYEIKSVRFPSNSISKSDMSTGVYYLKITDIEKCIKEVHEFIYGSTYEIEN